MRVRAVVVAVLALLVCAAACVVVVVGLPGGDDEAARPQESPAPRAEEPPPPAAEEEASLVIGPRVDDGYPIPVRQVRLPRGDGSSATGLLLVPPRAGARARGPMPAVVYLHGSGVTSEDFLFEAVHMAARGVVVLSLDDANVGQRPVPEGGMRELRADAARRRTTVADLRLALDALAARRDVDPERIAFVGFSRGANTGALMAPREPRFAALVFVAGGGVPGAGLASGPAAEALVAGLDPVRAVARDQTRRPRLVQYGLRDEALSQEDLAAFAAAVPEPRRVERYDAGHPIDIPAMRARLDWLTEQLGVTGPPVPGAPTVPPVR